MTSGVPTEELPVGRRVAYWRGRRGLSQRIFADRIGKSKSWVDKVERGARRLDKFSVLYEIADVLQIDVQLLLGKDPERRTDSPNGVDQVVVEDIRAALERYVALDWHLDGRLTAPRIGELRKAANHAWLSLQHSRYGTLTRALPRLLRDVQAADAYYTDGDNARLSAHLLGQVYQVSSTVLRKLGEHELAWLAADRAMAVSVRADDPLLAGIATCRAGSALLSLGRARQALEVNVVVAHRLAPDNIDQAAPDRLSVYGMLLLQGAMAAARLGDADTVRELFQGAQEAAGALGCDQNHYWTSFGPTNLELHRVAAAVELGEGRQAVDTHLQRLDPRNFAALLPERRAHHLLDLARGYAQIGDLCGAGEALVDGDRLAPSEIRCRPIAHELMSDILRRTRGAPPAPIAELAEHMGVGV
jgi:transcriptional regulator with XRE-family HTH domain